MALFMVLAVVAYVFYFAAVQGEPDNASHFSLVRRFVVFITLYIATLAVIFLIAHLFLSDSIENRLAVAVFANLAILFYTQVQTIG